MDHDHDTPRDSGSGVLTGALIIVLAGAALGVGSNLMMRASGPNKGLAWIKVERRMGSLDEYLAASDSLDRAAPDSAHAAAPATSAPPPAGTVTATASHTPPPAGTSRAPRPDPADRSSATADPAASDPHPAAADPTPPAATPTPVAPPASDPPPGTSAPAARARLPFIPDVREPLEVQYGTVKAFWDANAAVIVDARTAGEYAEGHIPGAVNLSFDDVFRNPDLTKNFDAHGKPIITYCGGGDCELSKSLAFSFIDAGHKKVLVFMGGLPGWKDAGQPVATGAAPGGNP